MTDDRKPCSLGIVSFLLCPRGHTKGKAASPDFRIQKAVQQTFFFQYWGWNPGPYTVGKLSTAVPHPESEAKEIVL